MFSLEKALFGFVMLWIIFAGFYWAFDRLGITAWWWGKSGKYRNDMSIKVALLVSVAIPILIGVIVLAAKLF